MFMNLAHRGASEYAPENTLAAFYKGLELGASGLETDLRRTKDGYIVLQHDQQVDRNTDGQGDLSEYTWQEASRLDAGSSFSDAYRGEPLVLLDTFLRQFARRPVRADTSAAAVHRGRAILPEGGNRYTGAGTGGQAAWV